MKYKICAVACALLGMSAGAAAEQTYILKLNHHIPSTAPVQRLVFDPWCAALKEESQGRLQCQIYPSMQLGGTPATLADMARNGVADIVWVAPSYSAGKFPRIEAAEQPFMLPVGAARSYPVIWDFYQQYAQEDFKDYKVLSVHGDGGMVLHTRGKPVTSLADFRGKRLRSSNRASSQLLDALGAAPINMSPSQMTESLSKGVIDGVLYTWASIREIKVDEVTEHHSNPPPGAGAFSTTVLAVLMNKKKFESLPPDLQQIIERNSGPALNQRFSEVWDADMAAGMAAMPAESVLTIAPEAYAEIEQAADEVAQNWIQAVARRGIDGGALLQGLRDIAAQPPAAAPGEQTAAARQP